MAGVTFSEKALRLTVTLDKAGANNVYTLTGFATHVAISKQGGVDFAKASVEVYGLSLDTMAQLTMLSFRPLGRRWNLLQVEAGEGGNYSVVFQGEVTNAYADLNGACPVMKMEAQTVATLSCNLRGNWPSRVSSRRRKPSGCSRRRRARRSEMMGSRRRSQTASSRAIRSRRCDRSPTASAQTSSSTTMRSSSCRAQVRETGGSACLRRHWDGRVPDFSAERHSSRFRTSAPISASVRRCASNPSSVRFGHLEDRQPFPRPNGTQARRRFVAHNVRGDVAR